MSRVISWYFQKIKTSEYIAYHKSLESVFFINLVSLKVTHVCEIITGFKNYDGIELYTASHHIL